MRTQAAVLWDRGRPWSIEDVELAPPKGRGVLVELAASGLCHSDDHLVTGDMPVAVPLIGGHEGAGTVLEVGPDATRVRPGDHVILTPLPSCGNCRWCASGRANLCDAGIAAMSPESFDSVYRYDVKGQVVPTFVHLGTFSHHVVVSDWQTVRIDDDIPLDVASLVGCGVSTGWGAAVKVAEVVPGDTVVVVGVGGVGVNAVQGARLAGAAVVIAVDPVALRRDAALSLGADLAVASVDEAAQELAELTRGVMADKVIVCVGVLYGHLVGPIADLVGKGGRLVITSVTPMHETTVTMGLGMFAMSNKSLLGHVFGQVNPVADFPRILSLYRSGALRLDELITRRYPLSQINEGYADMHAGRTVRGLVEHR